MPNGQISNADYALDILLAEESGGFVANDCGRGASKWGITAETLRALGYPYDQEFIEKIERPWARSFYRKEFLKLYNLDEIYDRGLLTRMLGLVVNVGPKAIKWLQMACMALGANGVTVTGHLGDQTARAVNSLPPDKVLDGVRKIGTEHYNKRAAEHPELYADKVDGLIKRLNTNV